MYYNEKYTENYEMQNMREPSTVYAVGLVGEDPELEALLLLDK